jgi:hypothetical protein
MIMGGVGVKKLLIVLVAAAAGFAVWRKLESDRAEQSLWAEATDQVN